MVALTLSLGCQQISIPDSIWYADKGELGALELHTLSPGKADIDKATWDKLRVGMLCTDYQTFADWKTIIEKLCSLHNDCNYPMMESFFNRIYLESLVKP